MPTNVCGRLLRRFEALSRWACFCVLNASDSKNEKRVKVLEMLIHLAKALFCLGDFHALLALVQGINAIPVDRLRTLKKALPKTAKAINHELWLLCKPDNDCAGVRSAYDEALAEGRCVIPSLGILLYDLVTLEKEDDVRNALKKLGDSSDSSSHLLANMVRVRRCR